MARGGKASHNQRGRKNFRDGAYYASVTIGKRTVKEGECCAVWTASGSRRLITGPQRVRLFFSQVRFLDRYVADGSQYLSVKYRDGRTENHRGPIAMFHDPCIVEELRVQDAIKLAANEALVVYSETSRLSQPVGTACAGASTTKVAKVGKSPLQGESTPVREQEGSTVLRRIVRGPAVFAPAANEWVHTFSWHGSIHEGKGSKTGTLGDEKKPHALTFQKLRQMPDQMYFSVPQVRTADDAQLTVYGMIFYELDSIEKMLDCTNDPIGDFINGVSADVMRFAATLTYELLMTKTSELSELATFPILAQRMQDTGFRLLKIVYRGYSTSAQLQSMHDDAIAKRTKLRLSSDTVEVEQATQAMELRCKQERSQQEKQIEEAAKRHAMSLAEMDHEARSRRRDAEHEQELRHAQETNEARLHQQRLLHDEELRRLAALKELGVELTKLMVAETECKPDTHVRIDAATPPALHLEMPRKAGAR